MRTDKIGYGCCTIAAVGFFHVGLILLAAYLCLFRVEFMNRMCDKYQVPSRLEISREDLHRVTGEMMAFVKGQEGDLDVTVTLGGDARVFFNERDRQHLEDIAGMVRSGKRFLVLGGLCFLGLLLFMAHKGMLEWLCRGYLFSWLFLLGLFLIVGIWMLADLTGFINAFHRLFFNNDRWILNPAKDMLIRLFPRALFLDGAVLLASVLGGIHVTVTVLAVWGRGRLLQEPGPGTSRTDNPHKKGKGKRHTAV